MIRSPDIWNRALFSSNRFQAAFSGGSEAGPRPAVHVSADTRVRAQTRDFATPSARDGFFHVQPAWQAPLPALAYPQTNDPSVWAGLHHIIRHSPLLLQQLGQLFQARWAVFWNRGGGSVCTPHLGRIDVDIAMDRLSVVQSLAHEASHAFDPYVAPANYPNEGAYLQAAMRNEGTAVISHLVVRSEIRANSGIDIGVRYCEGHYYDAAVDFYRHHRNYERLLQHVMALYVWEINTERVCYWQTFLRQYRDHWRLPAPMVGEDFLVMRRHEALQRLQWEMSTG